MKTDFIYNLDKVGKAQVSLVGGKGASLGELFQAGIPVPNGFVVATPAFEAFLSQSDNRLELNTTLEEVHQEKLSPAEAASRIQNHFNQIETPVAIVQAIEQEVDRLGAARVSVRSSATCEDGATTAWAGQLETFLEVPPRSIVTRVRECWLSIFNESALAYAVAHGFHARKFAVAVVVQKMVASEVSGIAFSVHPVTQEPDIQLIEAGLGLGEAVVSGRVVPDHYLLRRENGEILERSIAIQKEALFPDTEHPGGTWSKVGEAGRRQKLSDEQIKSYAGILNRIEDHFGHPVDTEWALEGKEFQLLQARPITTLAKEYREPLIDLNYQWQFTVRRPMSLLETSILVHWLDAKHIDPRFAVYADQSLSIQDETNITHHFSAKTVADRLMNHVIDLYRYDRPRLRRILEYGKDVCEKSMRTIQRGPSAFETIDQAVDFFADVAQHSTALPGWVLMGYEKHGFSDPYIRELAEELRAHSWYPAIQRNIIDPIAIKYIRDIGFSLPEHAPHLTTWDELRRGKLDRGHLESRLKLVQQGYRFIYGSIDNQDQLHFVSQTGYLLMRIAQQRDHVMGEHPTEILSGQVAYPGVVRGRARVVLSPDAVGQDIEPGEILVSIQSSPALMPLLKKCGGIITDDGGIACHASIIARELKKPTLTGTQRATSVIHTGDLVEIDTYNRSARILTEQK